MKLDVNREIKELESFTNQICNTLGDDFRIFYTKIVSTKGVNEKFNELFKEEQSE